MVIQYIDPLQHQPSDLPIWRASAGCAEYFPQAPDQSNDDPQHASLKGQRSKVNIRRRTGRVCVLTVCGGKQAWWADDPNWNCLLFFYLAGLVFWSILCFVTVNLNFLSDIVRNLDSSGFQNPKLLSSSSHRFISVSPLSLQLPCLPPS